MKMCPHCGWTYADEIAGLVPWHEVRPDEPGSKFVVKRSLGIAEACPGTEQGPRNPGSDCRPLWNGQESPAMKARKEVKS